MNMFFNPFVKTLPAHTHTYILDDDDCIRKLRNCVPWKTKMQNLERRIK